MIKEVMHFQVSENEKNQRLDKFLSDVIEDMSRTQLQDLIEKNNVFVNNGPTKSNYKLKVNDEIMIKVPEPEVYDVVPKDLNLEIVYEDAYVAIVNKPSGMVVHPAPGSYEDTLVHGLMYQIKDLSGINGVLRPGIVHRIDKDTSGLLMVAKNDIAHESLVNQLVDKSVTREYVALVHGVIEHNLGKIDAPIGRDPHDRKKMAVAEGGKNAVTHFQVLKRYKEFTLVKCILETGRTHQIRVHMKYINHPVAGDPYYGPKKVMGTEGQYLHAKTIGFTHPHTKERMEFSSELPATFQKLLDELDAE